MSLGLKITAAKIYEPSFSANPTTTYSNSTGLSSIQLSVPDHVQVVELTPAACD